MLVALHVVVRVIGNRKDVRGHLADLLVAVIVDVLGRVDGKDLVRVYRHQNRARVRLEIEEKLVNHLTSSSKLWCVKI